MPNTSSPYHDKGFLKLERELERLGKSGASASVIAARLCAIFIDKNRAFREYDSRELSPESVAADYLLPRKDLHHFAVENWIRHIFLPSLPESCRASLLVFGLGRLFSIYNDLGVQHSTDVDINIIHPDELGRKEKDCVARALVRLNTELHDNFGIVLELHADFSLLSPRDINKRMESKKPQERAAAVLFYKANEKSIRVIQDNPALREAVFGRVRELPDAYLFEHFLGLSTPKSSFCKIRQGQSLLIGQDSQGPRSAVKTVIGSRAYDLYCRRVFPQRLFISPPDWHFSMKYFVNRVYDYVCAMRNLGYSLGQIGLGSTKGNDGSDPDYHYLRNAHKLTLYLQELAEEKLGAYNAAIDSSYLSRERFLRFMEICGDRFRADFDGMVIAGGLIPPSRALRYQELQKKTKARVRDRFMEGPLEELKTFPPGFRYESTHKDANGYRIYVPYSWADSGYYVFSSIAERLTAIVEEKLIPALPGLGMPASGMARYLQPR